MSPLCGFLWSSEALDHLAGIPHKQRAQIVKKAKALILNPFPPGSKKLKGITIHDGEAVHRERSGDYRILYVVKTKPHSLVIVIDVDDRKDVYR